MDGRSDRILDAISSPADLKVLTDQELTILAREIREEILDVTSKNGGHTASSLGAVELILAVHSLIDCPRDKFVFDVGHQAYAHKLVTGRKDAFDTLRTLGGISGFPRPDESPYDVHPSGHASDSLSIALGLAEARRMRGTDERIVALIGDASLSGGMAFEALNMIGQMQLPMVIVLNDNEMSIARNVGALVKHLGAMRSSSLYRQVRDSTQAMLEDSGPFGDTLVQYGRNLKDSVKHFIVPQGMIFEQLGIMCTPPVDGHNITAVKEVLSTAFAADAPVIVHTVTRKGAGYAPAEKDPERFHGMGAFDIATGENLPKPPSPPSYTSVFGKAIVREAKADERIIGITAAMPGGTGLSYLAKEIPNQFIDVGIAEENAVGMAAGLALGGMKPVAAIYSTFLQRSVDQIAIDCALPNANVVFAIDRAGIVGDDGPTHHGIMDIPYLRMIPNMRMLAPSDEAELVNALHTALAMDGPVSVRYPRGAGVGTPIPEVPEILELGASRTLREGDDVALLAFGDRVKPCLDAAEILQGQGIQARVVDMRWIKPMDKDAIVRAAKTRLVVTVENGALAGGAGEGVLDVLSRNGLRPDTLLLGIGDAFVQHGRPSELLALLGLDAPGIASATEAKLKEIERSGS